MYWALGLIVIAVIMLVPYCISYRKQGREFYGEEY